MNRRYFVMSSTAAASALRASDLRSPADTVRIACVGVRGQGGVHISNYSKMKNVEVVALCDIDESVLERRLSEIEKSGRKRPAGFTDLRKLLEDKAIDAISIATPNHHHTLQTIWGCQAGKDVYVEKPCTHNVFEARQIVAAAVKYDRIVQHGTNGRSVPALREAVQQLRNGLIGEIYMARGLCFKWRDTIGRTPVEPLPKGVDYDLWLGPAPERPFTRNRFHYNWHWFWDYGNGDIGNQGIHQLDLCRWGLGVTYPVKVSAMGGHYLFDDDQETPNTLVSTFEFDDNGKKKLLVFEVRHWMTNREADIGRPGSNTLGCMFYGSKGFMTNSGTGAGYRTYLGKEQTPGPSSSESGNNWVNFIDAVRSRKQSDQNAPISEGAISTVLIHLANISYRLGRTIRFDGKTLTCPGDFEANQMLTRKYRTPFVVPENV
jgi:predicted dehydrogenase